MRIVGHARRRPVAYFGRQYRFSQPIFRRADVGHLRVLLVFIVLRSPVIPATRLTALAVTVGVATSAIGVPKAESIRGAYASLGVAAFAMRVNAVESLVAMQIEPEVIPVAKALNMYPFTDEFTLGCRGPELGSRIDLAAIRELNDGAVDTVPVRGDKLLSGWGYVNDSKPIACWSPIPPV